MYFLVPNALDRCQCASRKWTTPGDVPLNVDPKVIERHDRHQQLDRVRESKRMREQPPVLVLAISSGSPRIKRSERQRT